MTLARQYEYLHTMQTTKITSKQNRQSTINISKIGKVIINARFYWKLRTHQVKESPFTESKPPSLPNHLNGSTSRNKAPGIQHDRRKLSSTGRESERDLTIRWGTWRRWRRWWGRRSGGRGAWKRSPWPWRWGNGDWRRRRRRGGTEPPRRGRRKGGGVASRGRPATRSSPESWPRSRKGNGGREWRPRSPPPSIPYPPPWERAIERQRSGNSFGFAVP